MTESEIDPPPPIEPDLAMQRLAEIEAYYDHAPVGLCVLDTELRYVRINERLAEINGVPLAEHLGRRVRDVLPTIAEQTEPWLLEVIETGEALRDVEITIESDDGAGTMRTRVENWYPMRNADGQVYGINIVVEDLTERKREQAELAKLNAELEARVAHRTVELDAANTELRQEISERMRLEAEIVEISERVQSRIGQDLHDDLGQQLSAIAMLASALEHELKRTLHPKAEAVARFGQLVKHAINTTRSLAKGLYPVELDKGGFTVALEQLARGTEAVSGVECVVHSNSAMPLGASAAIHLYRIVQEALNNALKHGQPRRIVIECSMVNQVPTVIVANDGAAFKKPVGRMPGLGLHILEYRARLLGAEITIGPGKEGGCRLVCSLPRQATRRLL